MRGDQWRASPPPLVQRSILWFVGGSGWRKCACPPSMDWHCSLFHGSPATPTLAGGALRIQGVAFGPRAMSRSKDPSSSLFFFLFSKSLEMDRSRLSGWFKKKKWKEKFFLNQIYNNMSKFEFCFNSIRSLLMELCIKIFLFENIPNIFRVALSKIRRFSWLRINCRSKFSIVCI